MELQVRMMQAVAAFKSGRGGADNTKWKGSVRTMA